MSEEVIKIFVNKDVYSIVIRKIGKVDCGCYSVDAAEVGVLDENRRHVYYVEMMPVFISDIIGENFFDCWHLRKKFCTSAHVFCDIEKRLFPDFKNYLASLLEDDD